MRAKNQPPSMTSFVAPQMHQCLRNKKQIRKKAPLQKLSNELVVRPAMMRVCECRADAYGSHEHSRARSLLRSSRQHPHPRPQTTGCVTFRLALAQSVGQLSNQFLLKFDWMAC